MAKIPVKKETTQFARLAMLGLAGVCVICVTQILTLAVLDLPVKLGLGGFAIALPLLTVAGMMHEGLLDHSLVDSRSQLILAGVAMLGCIGALWGLTFVFWHFHWVFGVLFLASSSASAVCALYFDAHSEPSDR